MAPTSTNSVATTDMSDTSSLDVSPPPRGVPLSKLFSFCSPKSEDDPNDYDDRVDTPVEGRTLNFESEATYSIPEKEVEEVIPRIEEIESPVLFDRGLVFQIGLVGAVLAFDMLA
eukprot:scaffold2299_cov131-Cylindrotheca_fusiformis.AAC.2